MHSGHFLALDWFGFLFHSVDLLKTESGFLLIKTLKAMNTCKGSLFFFGGGGGDGGGAGDSDFFSLDDKHQHLKFFVMGTF